MNLSRLEVTPAGHPLLSITAPLRIWCARTFTVRGRCVKRLQRCPDERHWGP